MNLFMKRLLSQIAIVVIVFLAAAGIQTFAFTEPTVAPLNGNVDAPLNTGSSAQDKTGFLTADNIGSSFGAYLGTGSCSTASDCYVGIGTISPTAKLDVRGPILASDTSTACGSTIKGAIRYNSTSGGLEWCDGSTWSPISTGGSASVHIVNGVHTSSQCTNAGGNPYSIGGGDYVCEFSGSSCPSGSPAWNKYLNWTQTAPGSGNGTYGGPPQCTGFDAGCSTSFHNFANNATIESCTYSIYDNDPINGCVVASSGTAYASVVDVGCY